MAKKIAGVLPHNTQGESMSQEKAVCKALESLLHAATGRQPRGRISEVMLRLITNIADYTNTVSPTSWHESSVLEDDRNKLSDAIWRVLTSRGDEDELGIAGTIPGVSGSTSRIDFVRQYASDFLYMTPVGHFRVYSKAGIHDYSEAEIAERFEEWLVAAALLFRANYPENEFFSIKAVYAGICTYGEVFPDTVSTETISERLLAALAAVETAAMNAID